MSEVPFEADGGGRIKASTGDTAQWLRLAACQLSRMSCIQGQLLGVVLSILSSQSASPEINWSGFYVIV